MGIINQKDIALALKLSGVTVSKALQDHSDIALITRKLVKDKAKELEYVPNFIGRSLSSKKSYYIPVQEMCYATVDLLVKLINNKPVAEKVIQFDGEIVFLGFCIKKFTTIRTRVNY